MSETINNMIKKHDYLVCIDSDGCAFDSMESKHRKCFGPQVSKFWKLNATNEEVCEKWNEINLYSSTRATNRFKGLVLVLKALGEADWKIIAEWIGRSEKLSNETLALEENPVLKKTLQWSLAVNNAISELPLPVPFSGVKEALMLMEKDADIVIVSSTNPAALENEWRNADLMPYLSAVLSQNDGSKKECISQLLKKGYVTDHVLMIGDALGDYHAAKENKIHFYPIMPREEGISWKRFIMAVYPAFSAERFNSIIEADYSSEFLKIFDK